MSKQGLEALFGALIAAVVTIVLAPAWNDLWADWKPVIGAPLLTLIDLLAVLSVFALCLAILHYYGVLGAGAEPIGTRERSDYDTLRRRIAAGNQIEREYARRLTSFLSAIDKFFGDARMADHTLFPRAFGLQTPAPLWTAPAFDRCLLLALVYPIGAVVLIWATSNHVGPAEAALSLESTEPWRRAATVAGLGFAGYAGLHLGRSNSWRGVVGAVLAFIVAATVVVAVAGAVAVSVSLTLAVFSVVVFGTARGAVAVAIAVAVAVAIPVGVAVGVAVAIPIGIAVAIPIGTLGTVGFTFSVFELSYRSEKRGWQGLFLLLFEIAMLVLCIVAPAALAPLSTWYFAGPILLFFGLLTLLNAPFDWFSIGLTRALLRRGLERKEWWPYFYAVVDAVLASFVIAILAEMMVAGVQVFDDLAVRYGGARILPPMAQFLDAIKADPGKPEYWWVYATLFSTMLPSVINLFIGGVALARGVPGIRAWLLGKIREGEAVPAYDRLLVALVLTVQNALGLAFAIIAQGILLYIVIGTIMPRLGIGILDLARLIAH